MTNYTVYILKCSDGTLYTGITNDLDKRILTHNKGKGAKYTRGRTPVILVASLGNLTKSDALKLEYQVKRKKKEDKVAFLMSQ
jgi:putative endonuclease